MSAQSHPRLNGNGSAGVSFESFAETFSQVPQAVTVVTTKNGDESAHGTTVSAICSLSADPPLLLVALDRSSELLKQLRKTRRFGVNLLSADQKERRADVRPEGRGQAQGGVLGRR